jgi:hypothetical protein
MARLIVIFLLLIHGLIHLAGFSKAFGYADITAFTKHISKTAGAGWLLGALLFLSATIGYLYKKEWWPVAAIIAVIISQILIFSAWKEARWGSVINLFIVLTAICSYAGFRFEKKTTTEISQLMQRAASRKFYKADLQKLEDLPPIVRQWLQRSGALKQPGVQTVRLRQQGQMRTKPSGRWMPFTAVQYFTITDPGFVWNARLRMAPLIYMTGRDKLEKGKGEMQMKLMSLLNVVNEANNEKINSGSMVRYLAEICWFPVAALQPWIEWEAMDSLSAKATLRYEAMSITGVFQFNREGDITGFSANRYKGSDDKAILEQWVVEMLDYKEFGGIRIPYKSNVSWKLKEGDFNWLSLEITDLSYNNYNIYR